jgi:surfactin family lipopeptide synthetase A
MATPVQELLGTLRRKGITLALIDGEIRYRGPPGSSSVAEFHQIRSRKSEFVKYLTDISASMANVASLGSYPRVSPLPLSCAQRWWWELEAVAGPTPQPLLIVPVTGAVNAGLVKRALAHIFSRHEILRTRFAASGSTAVPIIDPPGEVWLKADDFAHLPEADRAARASKRVDEYRFGTFELNGGPLVKAHLIRLSNSFHLVLISLHHITMDAWSATILKRELRGLLADYLAGKDAALPSSRIQHADFAIWEQHWLATSNAEDPYAFWDTTLAAVAPIQMPLDVPRPPGLLGLAEALLPFELSAATLGSLRQFSRTHKVTVQVCLLAVYSMLVSHWTGRREVLVGNYTAHRPPGTEDIVGCLVANRPVLSTVLPEVRFVDYLEQVRRAYLVALDFRRPVSLRTSWQKRLHAVIVNYWKSDADSPGTPPSIGQPKTVHHELALSLQETPTAIRGTISYAQSLFRADTVERFRRHFLGLAAIVTTQPLLEVATAIHKACLGQDDGV